MSQIENRIREFGQKRNEVALQQYVEGLDVQELITLIRNRITNSNFVHLWYYIMQAFTDSSESHRKRFRIVSVLLRELEKGGLSNTQSSSIITRVCIELPKFKPQHLIELCTFCTECIQKGNVTEMCWKEILPEILNVLVEVECLEYNDTEMTGLEYKTQLINSLCMLVWSANILASLAAMFIDIPLSKDEYLQVVNKLGQNMEQLTCQELPVFIYQLLKLCRSQDTKSIFLRLQYYFGTRIYSRLQVNQETNSESMNMDVIADANEQEAIEVESTVLYHIYQSATQGHVGIENYLTSFKNMIKSPEFVLHPFQFTVLLTLSNVSVYEERVLELLRMCISRATQEEHRKLESCWFREMVPSTCKIEDVLKQIIDCCGVADRHLVIHGLVQLAYILLGVGALLGRDANMIAEKQWQLGKMILLNIIKKKRQIAPHILQSLSNRIVTGQNVVQYIECISIITRKMLSIMLENQSCVIELLEYIVQAPGPIANQLFDAVLPLIKVSPTVRDHLILLLRKSLYSRTTETRQMAVTGFLKLIKNLKISNLAALSQSSSSSSASSGHSLLTQASLNCSGRAPSSAFSNEALCLEVLGILRRCFMQQAEVRTRLYDGLYDAVCINPELGIPVLDVIWIHFSELYVADENSLPPLRFSKITVTKDIDVVLQEPLGKLIYAIGLIVTKVQEEDSDNPTVTKFITVLESLCTRMINCELINFELDDGTDLLDILPESQQKLCVLREALCVYEALIGYKICSWGPQSENHGQQINSLFQSYSRLLNFAKNLMRPKKGDKKKKTMDGNKTTQQSQNTTKIDGTHKSSKTLKLPSTVLDFQTVGKILHLLHEIQVSWTTTEQAIIISRKCDIHRHMMQAAIQLVQRLKSLKTAELQQTKMYYNYVTEIAGILYERCIVRLYEFINFDCTTAVLALECFHSILVTICTHYRNNLSAFLSAVAGKSKDEEFETVLTIFIEQYEKLFELDEKDASSEPEVKKISLIVINTITLLSSHIPTQSNVLSVQVMEWLKNYNNTLANKHVASAFINLIFHTQIKYKITVGLFETVALRLSEVIGTINEDKPNTDELQLISEATALSVFPLLCNSIKTMLDDIDWIILRLRAEYGMISYPGEDNPERRREYLKSKERGICCQLCPIITIVGVMCNITIPSGGIMEGLMKLVGHLYNCLNSLTKYFILRSSKINLVFQTARFESVVKIAGKQLASVVYDFIIYIEESQKQQAENTQGKKKSVDTSSAKSKVLRETRLIPKTIYEMEQFGKSIIQLSNKTKVDLARFVGQGTARDFRIKGLKEILEQVANEANTSHDDDTTIGDVSMDSESNMNGDDLSNEESGEEEAPPPKKKAKNKK